MNYIVIETCSSGPTSEKPPYSRVQSYADGSTHFFSTSKEAAKSALQSKQQPHNGVVNTSILSLAG